MNIKLILILSLVLIIIVILLLTSSTEKFKTEHKYTIYWTSFTQLGNGLRGMSSLAILAEETNRDLVLVFEKANLVNKDTLVKFTNILDHYKSVNSVDSSKMDKLGIKPPNLTENYSREYLEGDFRNYNTNFHPHEEAIINIKKVNEWKDLFVNVFYSMRPNNLSPIEFRRRRVDWYKKHIYPKYIDKAKQVINNQRKNNKKVIGWHFRHTDNLKDGNKRKHIPSNENILSVVKQQITENPGCVIFVCTDNISVINGLIKDIKDKIVFAKVDPEFTRQQQAFWEMILLSQTDLIIGSPTSSFSYESYYIGNTPSINYDVVDKKWNKSIPVE